MFDLGTTSFLTASTRGNDPACASLCKGNHHGNRSLGLNHPPLKVFSKDVLFLVLYLRLVFVCARVAMVRGGVLIPSKYMCQRISVGYSLLHYGS